MFGCLRFTGLVVCDYTNLFFTGVIVQVLLSRCNYSDMMCNCQCVIITNYMYFCSQAY